MTAGPGADTSVQGEAGTGADRRVGPLAEWTADRMDEVLDESVPRLLARRLRDIGDRPALYLPDGDGLAPLTFAELAEAATEVAGALVGSGVTTGERVAVWSTNSLEYIVLQYAVALAGAVLAPFNTAWSDAEVVRAVALTRPRLVVAGTAYAGDSLVPRATALAEGATVVDLAGLREWALRLPVGPLPEVDAGDPMLIQFTSGTTGRAKGAVVTHRSALNGALQRNLHDANPDNDVWLNPVPYFHIGGSCFVVLGGLLGGNAFVVAPRWNTQEALRLLRLGMITRLGGVPTMLVDVLDGLDREGGSPRELGIASVSLGGATVTQHMVGMILARLDAPTLISYGQSECPLITSTRIDQDLGAIGGTIGRPLPGTHVRIVDPGTGRLRPLGVPGEIVVRSPGVMAGYWEMPEETAAVVTADGFLCTGDLGSMDERGYITFCGRVRDVIIRGGENVYPAEVEEILLARPDVAAAVLVGVDDLRLGERVAATVVRAPGGTVDGAELAAYLAGRVSRFKIPVEWRFVEDLPMTASGKVRRFVVREETNAELAGAPRAAPAPGG